jgi:polar amino acid transport system substrate-binding protein
MATVLLTFYATSMARATDDVPIHLLVFNRPPYFIMDQGKPAGGFLLDIALAVFDRAGVPHIVREMPPGRIGATLQIKSARACTVGWLKTPQRETLARFSPPIYSNKAMIAVVHDSSNLTNDNTSLEALLKTDLTWGLRSGFSYGHTIDAAFAAYPEHKIHRFSDPHSMLRLLAKKRLDVVLIAPEELAWLRNQEPGLVVSLRTLPLADAPPSFTRHIVCGTAVNPAVMDRINAALMEYMDTDEYRRLIDSASQP